MSEIVKGALNGALDVVEKNGENLFMVVDAAQNAAFETMGQALDIGDESADKLMAEARELFGRAMGLVRQVVEAVADPLP